MNILYNNKLFFSDSSEIESEYFAEMYMNPGPATPVVKVYTSLF